jgi:hypothetical protein
VIVLQRDAKALALSLTVFLTCVCALLPLTAGAGSITLTPTAQTTGGSVTVSGVGFGASRNIGIAFGSELSVTGEIVNQIVNGDTRDYNFTHRPIKPGSVQIVHLNLITGSAPLVTDDGNGNLYTGSSQTLFSNAMNYALGNFHREGVAVANPADYLLTASYTRYQYSLTSYGGITTDASGKFSGNFIVPAVSDGNYTVTVIDATGNMAVSTLAVSTPVPEVLPFGAILLLSLVAIVSSHYLRKRPKIMLDKM